MNASAPTAIKVMVVLDASPYVPVQIHVSREVATTIYAPIALLQMPPTVLKTLIASSKTANPQESAPTLVFVTPRKVPCAMRLMKPYLEQAMKDPNVVPPPVAVSGIQLES